MARAKLARNLVAALTAMLLAWLGGVGSTTAQVLDASTHRIGIGDMLQVTLFGDESPVTVGVQVDNTGKISLPLLGPVQVAGLFTYEAANKLTELYKVYYINPVITLSIQQYGTFKIFIFGPDVPGQLIDVPNGMRLLDFIQSLAEQHSEIQAPLAASTGRALLKTGRFRRLHLIRGGFNLTALLTPPTVAPGQKTSTPAPNLLQSAAPEAVARNSGNLAAYTNWRPWVEERRRDPASQVWIIDPLRLTVEGELSSYNITLQNEDVLYIPSPERFIDIEGVTLSGRYELLGEETLGDILRMAGTPNYEADLMNAVIRRYDVKGVARQVWFNFYPALDSIEVAKGFKLQNRDRISFYARESRVFVLGEVQTGGAFAYQYDSTVLDYIALAEGETNDANLAWIAIIRQSRDRLDPLKGAEVTQVNFKRIHKGLPNCTDISVDKGDVIYVPPKGFEFDVTSILQAVGTVVTGVSISTRSSSNTTNSNGV